jgi:hypothetical protein
VELAERHEVVGASAGRRGGRRLDLSVRKPAGGYRLERGYRTTAIPLRPAWKAQGRIGCTVPAPRPSAWPWEWPRAARPARSRKDPRPGRRARLCRRALLRTTDGGRGARARCACARRPAAPGRGRVPCVRSYPQATGLGRLRQVQLIGKAHECCIFELSDPLPAEAELLADRLERGGLAVEAEPKLEHPPLTLGKRS